MLKKIGLVIGIILLVLIAGIGVFYVRYQAMARNVTHQAAQLGPLDLSKIADGVYTGSFGDFLVYVEVAVTIKNHQIADLKIKEQRAGQGYEALETLGRIIKVQSPKVDAVTGATGSSKSIMIAVHRALKK